MPVTLLLLTYPVAVFVGLASVSLAASYTYPSSESIIFSERFSGLGAYPFALLLTAIPAGVARWLATKMGKSNFLLAAGLGVVVGLVMGTITSGAFEPLAASNKDEGGALLMFGYVAGGGLGGLAWLLIERAAFADTRKDTL